MENNINQLEILKKNSEEDKAQLATLKSQIQNDIFNLPQLTKIQDENKKIKEKIEELSKSYKEFQQRIELTDEEIKNTSFIKSKLEYERNNLEKEVKTKKSTMEGLISEKTNNIATIQDLTKKIHARDIENKKLQDDNSKLLDIVLERDKEIRELTKLYPKNIKKLDKGINTYQYKESNIDSSKETQKKEIVDLEKKIIEEELKTEEL